MKRILPLRLLQALRFCVAALCLGAAADAQSLAPEMVQMERCPNGGLQPRIVLTEEGVLHVVYFKGALEAGDLFYVQSSDYGASYSEPVRVNTTPGNVEARGGIRGARMHLGASGRLHVVWVGASPEAEPEEPGEPGAPGAPGEPVDDGDLVEQLEAQLEEVEAPLDDPRALYYARSLEGFGSFEPERRLGGETHLLDSAPAVVDGSKGLFVFWHEPEVQPAGAAVVAPAETTGEPDAEPVRRIYMLASSDGGDTFGEPWPIETDDYIVNERCSIGAGTQEDGAIFVVFQGQNGKKRDWRLLLSRNGGETFRSRFVDNWDIPRRISTSATVTPGAKALLVCYESYGKVWFTRIDPEKRRTLMPYAARDSADWRGRPSVATNDFKVGLLAWIEGDTPSEPERVVWQAFHLGERRNIGMGRVHELPEGTTPAVFVRPDQSFCVLY